MNSKSKWAEMQEQREIINKLTTNKMDVQKQTKRQWISIVVLALVEVLTKLGII